MKMITYLSLWTVAYLAFLTSAHAISASLQLNKSQVALGESIQVTLTVENGTGEEQIDVPNITFGSFRYLGPSSQIMNINGRITKLVGYMYQLTCQAAGDHMIPAFGVKTHSVYLKTDPLRIKVLTAAESQRMGDSVVAEDDLKVELSLDKTEMYVNEPVLAKVRVYQRSDLRLNGQIGFDPPQFKDMIVKTIENQNRFSETKNGVPYDVIELRYLLLPGKSGEYTVDPVSIRTQVFLEDKHSRSRRDPMSSFFGDDPFDSFFGVRRQGKNIAVSRASNPLSFTVKALPKPVPEHFKGTVGRYEMKTHISGTHAKVGDALTLNIEIKGVGDLNSIHEPYMDFGKAFKTFESEAEVKTLDAELMIAGSKNFKKILIPLQEGKWTVPAVEFIYFDTFSGKYEVLGGESFVLHIQKNDAESSQGDASIISNKKIEDKVLDLKITEQGILFPPPRSDLLKKETEKMPWRRLKNTVVILPILLLALWLLKNRQALQFNVSPQKNALKIWRKDIGVAGKKQNLKACSEFISRAMYRYLGAVFEVSAESLSPKEALKYLQIMDNHPLPSELCSFLEQLDALVFGYMSDTETDMLSLMKKADHLIIQVDVWMRKNEKI